MSRKEAVPVASPIANIAAGTLGSMVGEAVVFPIDVVKTRLMLKTDVHGVRPTPTRAHECVCVRARAHANSLILGGHRNPNACIHRLSWVIYNIPSGGIQRHARCSHESDKGGRSREDVLRHSAPGNVDFHWRLRLSWDL